MQDIDDGRIPSPPRDPFEGDGGLGGRKEVMVLVDGDASLDSEGRSTHVDLLPHKVVGKPEGEAKDGNPFPPFGFSVSLDGAEDEGDEIFSVGVDLGVIDNMNEATLRVDRPILDPTHRVPTKELMDKLDFETDSASGTLEIEGGEEGCGTTSNLNYLDINMEKETRKRKTFSDPGSLGEIQIKSQKTNGAAGGHAIVSKSKMAAGGVSSNERNGSDKLGFDFDSEDEDNLKTRVTQQSAVVVAKPLDVNLMRHCIEMGQESLNLVAGKDVILCVGKTGTGKSSFIQGIAGKEFKKSSYEVEMASKDVFEAEDPVPGFEIGHAKSSMTKHIKCFFRQGNANSHFAYLDTPGFDDTEGEEVDIATSVMLNQVAVRSRSLRFVVMINYVSLLEDRGGAMRAIVKFMSHFVLDFNSDKTSFMFLFSRADEVKDVPESLEGAKKNLLNEIIMTIHGTHSEEARNVLGFIRKSLEKGFPFVDVFHPMKTNFLSLAEFIENQQEPVKKPNSSAHCFLTLSSQMRLGSAVENLLAEMRILLGREHVDVDGIRQIRDTFASFEMCLDFEDVQRTSRDSKDLLEQYVSGLKLRVESDIVTGTTSNRLFSSRNVEDLKRCIRDLSVLGDDFSVQAMTDTIVRRVRTFQECLFLTVNNSFDGLCNNLCKLRVWKEFDRETELLYDEVVVHLTSLIETLSTSVLNYRNDELATCGSSMPLELVGNLKALKSLNENSKALEAYIPCVSDASKVFLNFVEKLQNILVSRNSEACSMVEVLDFCDDQSVERLVSNIRNTEAVDKLLQETYTRDRCLTSSNLGDIESMIVGKFKEACSILKDTAQKIDEGWISPLTKYRDVTKEFCSLQGQGWKAMASIHLSVIDRIKSILKAKSGELDEMSHNALHFGLFDGNRDGEALACFTKCQWFDGLLSSDERFVENCVAKVESAYREKFARSEESFGAILLSISHQSGHVSKANDLIRDTVEVKRVLLEIIQSSKFGECVADQELLNRASLLHLLLHDHIRARAQKWDDSVRSWESAMEKPGHDLDEVALLTEDLDLILHEIEVIDQMDVDDCIKQVVESSRSEILQAFASFRLKVNERFEANPAYDEMVAMLAYVQAMTSFTRTAPHLPNIEDLKESARKRISSDAERIEQMVEQPSEFDSIDSLLIEFEKATVLDSFVSQEVSNRLRPLKRLRSIKEGEVDEHVKKMIENNYFEGIRELLLKLRQSRDQSSIQRFKRCTILICDSLEETSKELSQALYGNLTEESAQTIARSIGVLEAASDEGGWIVAQTYDARDKADTAKKEITKKIKKLEGRMTEATRRADFADSAILNGRLVVISKYLYGSLDPISKINLGKALELYCTLKESIPSRIDNFCHSFFVETAGIEMALTGLKVATGETNLCFHGLEELYSESVRLLEGKILEVIRSVQDSAATAKCYDDAMGIFVSLNRSMERGLGAHLPREVQDDFKGILESLREARKIQEGELSFDGCIKLKLETWATTMDELKLPRSWLSWPPWGGSATATYEKKKKILESEVRNRYTSGLRAVRIRDFVGFNDYIEFLGQVDEQLGRHVQSAAKCRQLLKKKAFETFVKMCHSCQESLQSDNYREFEPLFFDFRSVVLNITCIFEDKNAEKCFHLTIKVLLERMQREISSLEESIGKFNFSDTKVKVENLRTFGGFIADRFSLLRSELKICDHVLKSDKCLDNLQSLICKYFHAGRDFKKLKFYAILGVLPSASKIEIEQAYSEKAKFASDNCDSIDKHAVQAKFLQVKEAFEELKKCEANVESSGFERPFDSQLRSIGENLRINVRQALDEQRYDQVENLLFKLQGIEVLDQLVDPVLDSEKIRNDSVSLVKGHVAKIRVEVDSSWCERLYQNLNHQICDLKMMEDAFKSYSAIFPSSWNTGIIQSVEEEIDRLGKHCRNLLQNRSVAMESRNEFRRDFLKMGSVLLEVPLFKDQTRKVMSDVLESCLKSNWGHAFLFELGLSLQKRQDGDSEDEIRIAQTLVTEFKHFKEVFTMIWNEETIQKPPEDTIQHVRGEDLDKVSMQARPLIVNQDELLENFYQFELKYKEFLGEYLRPESDLRKLSTTTRGIAEALKPISCETGFGADVKTAIPTIMAGVFALFTVLKSGESYNRLEEAADGYKIDSKNLLMKPHNIQILTLLCMFGCGTNESSSLRSQLMQIRTGEGKSMIVGAAAVIFGLLGFRVRCVCYSEYLLSRDYDLFRDIFKYFDLFRSIKYSKITTLSEETTAAKGNIRDLTLALMHGQLAPSQSSNSIVPGSCISDMQMGHSIVGNDRCEMPSVNTLGTDNLVAPTTTALVAGINQKTNAADQLQGEAESSESRLPGTLAHSENCGRVNSVERNPKDEREEILLVDEVDVFFGPEFYGQTYNQVAQLREPEVAELLRHIWTSNKQGRRRLRAGDVKLLPAFQRLTQKLPGYDAVLENEVALMLNQVLLVNDEPHYYLDHNDRIGYKVMDAISYDVTFGYRTVFAYLKEDDEGNLKNPGTTLSRVLVMPISCGQFSYANICPARIIGVSGTLEVMGAFEKRVLQQYGVSRYLYVPSVYGMSHFTFDKAGDGVHIEKGIGDFFHKITEEISSIARDEKRAIIVFFKDLKRLEEYIASPLFRKLGRKKEILTEKKTAAEKEFVISKAATTGQITLATAAFGRGTDFFSKDETVQRNGGVHVVQTFLSSDMSEEIQIQGRTARQGKKGTYKLILLDKDLDDDFGIKNGSSDNWPRQEFYAKLCEAREKSHENHWQSVEINLSNAKAKDETTHSYFDALLRTDADQASLLLKELYVNMKRKQTGAMSLDLSFAIDITGSMGTYAKVVTSTVRSLLDGNNCLLSKLKLRFPDTEFRLRMAVLGYRDIDDGSSQFVECMWNGNVRFTENAQEIIPYVKTLVSSTSGGADVAEDHLGAIQRCAEWNTAGDWEGTIKAILLLTDAPAHGSIPNGATGQNVDCYGVGHPSGHTVDTVSDTLLQKDIDVFICSLDPYATSKFEENFSQAYNDHVSNREGRKITLVPLVSTLGPNGLGAASNRQIHIVFVLDESRSMEYDWSGVVAAYNKYVESRRRQQFDSDMISVVQFDNSARVTVQLQSIADAPISLDYGGHGTSFAPAAASAADLVRRTPESHMPAVIFMSDGMADDAELAANTFQALNQEVLGRYGAELELNVVGFGNGTNSLQLVQLAYASGLGRLHSASDVDALSRAFVQIAGGSNVASVLEAEVGRRISDAVSNRLAAEYMG